MIFLTDPAVLNGKQQCWYRFTCKNSRDYDAEFYQSN